MTTVTLYWTDLDDDALTLEQLEVYVSAAEATRARRRKEGVHRRRFLSGRAVLRSLLAERLDCAPRDAPLMETGGRPELIGGGFSFSLSRSAGRGLVALSSTTVGCDLERIDAAFDIQATAAIALSAAERDILSRADAGSARRLFFQAWALKEAYLKARGVGLAEPPDGLTVLRGDWPVAFALPEGWAWSFVDLGADWAAAVVARQDPSLKHLTLRGPFPYALAR